MGQTKSRINDEAIVIKQEKNIHSFGRVGICETKGTKRPLIACEAKYSKRDPQFYIDLKHPNLVTPLVYDAHFKEFLDLNAKGVTFYFDYLDISLEDIVRSRKTRNLAFPEQEIINIAQSILSTLLYLKEFDIEGGNIEPSTIFYSQGQIKIYINQLILGRLASYSMIVNYFPRKPLPSPEVLFATKKREVDLVEKYRYETDIFTLGLTLLEMATLEKSSDLFNIEIRQINIKLLEQRYALIKTRYSDRLNNLIRQMLTMDPKHRPSGETLINQIRGGIASSPLLVLSPRFPSRTISISCTTSPLNQSYLNASQLFSLNNSNACAYPAPHSLSNSRQASAERNRTLTNTNTLASPADSKINGAISPKAVMTENANNQFIEVKKQFEQKQLNKPIENGVVQYLPNNQQSQKEVPHIPYMQLASKPQYITSTTPKNFTPVGRSTSSYSLPQQIQQVSSPYQGFSKQGLVSPPKYPVQQFLPQQFQSNQQTVQVAPQTVQNQFVGKRLSFATSPQNINKFPQPQAQFNGMTNNFPQNVPRGKTLSITSLPGQSPMFAQNNQQNQYKALQTLQSQNGHYNPYPNQPTIQSPFIQNQGKSYPQNHQSETATKAQNLDQKVQELDERVSKSIANSVKVTQNYNNVQPFDYN